MTYVDHIAPTNTPQTEALPNQVPNNAGGFSFSVGTFGRLERFLILGSEGGTYYVNERKLTQENAKCILAAAAEDLGATIATIVNISKSGRAAKNDPAIFALAVLVSHKVGDSYPYAEHVYPFIPDVCRIGTHLFQFVNAVNQLRGWGSGLRKAIANWYTSKGATQLAMQVTKYAQREGWSHRDVLRLAHPKTDDFELNNVLKYVTQREQWHREPSAVELLRNVEEARVADEKRLIDLILTGGLVREHLPTEALNSVEVWRALLTDMPATAMLRNLGKMSSIGLIKPLSSASNTVRERLTDPEFLRRGRLHPFSILLALTTYRNGGGYRGKLTWTPDPQIVAALDEAFYLSFGLLEPTNKRFLLGIDVSGSMTWPLMNSPVTCAMGAACMAMVAYRTEPQAWAFGFANEFRNLGITPRDSLAEVCRKTSRMNFGSTDCSLPMTYALQHGIEADVFCVYTDNETYAGRVHPHIALEQYRQHMGIDAKLVVFGMTATDFTIANPNDPGMLDVVGFDAAAPKIVSEFVK